MASESYIEGLNKMVIEAKRAAEVILSFSGEIRLISHYDADGISSAAIMAMALSRAGKRFRLTLLRQLEEEYIKDLSKEKNAFYVITDMGSGQLEKIKKHLNGSKIIICDHHEMQGVPDDNIIHINAFEAGMGNNMSGSGVSYILARAMSKKNTDLSFLAIIGAIGDSQIDSIGKNWGLNGLNREILKDAQSVKKIKVAKGIRLWGRYTRPVHKALEYTIDPFIPGITGSEERAVALLNELKIPLRAREGGWRTLADLTEDEQRRLASGIIVARINGRHENPDEIFGDVYEFPDRSGEFKDANEFATILNSCGKTGKADLGVRLCLKDKGSEEEAKKTVLEYRRLISSSVRWAQIQIEKKTDCVIFGKGIYLLAEEKIPEDIISNVMSIINHAGIIKPGIPIFGFAGKGNVKVSARIDKTLTGGPVNLKEIVFKAASACGGEGGGHATASGARIPPGMHERFISIVEDELTNLNISNTINEDTNSI